MGPEAQFSPPDDDPLRKATPCVDDVEARRARSAIEGRLFAGRAERVKVGRYHVRSRIGAGGMGVVYRAHDPELARDVAVKVMNPEGISEAEADRAKARLVREARAMARLAHPNVIHVYDVGTVEDGVFIAMELVEGLPLSTWLIQMRPEWSQILTRFLDAGRGLAAAHAAGVVHRDFKPENVLLGSDGRVRVGDFGLAGAPTGDTGPSGPDPSESTRGEVDRAAVDVPLTRTGALLGTPKYMSPEQELGDPADARSDQFSFCVALWEALYGVPPYEGKTVAIYRQHVQQGVIASPPTETAVPSAVYEVLVRGLAVEPELRHPDMETLLDRLEAAATTPQAAVGRSRYLAMTLAGLGAIAVAGWVVFAGDTSERIARGSGIAMTQVSRRAFAEHEPALPATRVDVGWGGQVAAADAAGPTPAPGGQPDTDSDIASVQAAKPDAATPKAVRVPPRRGKGYCYYEQDSYDFLGRRSGRTTRLSHPDRGCYSCYERPHLVGSTHPTDGLPCDHVRICRPEAAEECSD